MTVKKMVDQRVFRDLLDQLYDGVYVVDKERRIVYWNTAAEQITGFTKKEVVGRHCHDNILKHISVEGAELCSGGCPLIETIDDGVSREMEIYLNHKGGHRLPVSLRVTRVINERGMVVGGLEVFNDNSSKMAIMERNRELEQLAMKDELTGLGNRRYGSEHVGIRLAELGRYGIVSGLIFVDIDNFKRINDKYGHTIGDQVLNMVARTLEHNLRTSDFVCRWGGEEFVALIFNTDPVELLALAERLRVLVKESAIRSDSRRVSATISVGATMATDEDTVETLVDRSDKLMYASKARGRDRVTMKLAA